MGGWTWRTSGTGIFKTDTHGVELKVVSEYRFVKTKSSDLTSEAFDQWLQE